MSGLDEQFKANVHKQLAELGEFAAAARVQDRIDAKHKEQIQQGNNKILELLNCPEKGLIVQLERTKRERNEAHRELHRRIDSVDTKVNQLVETNKTLLAFKDAADKELYLKKKRSQDRSRAWKIAVSIPIAAGLIFGAADILTKIKKLIF